MAWQDITDRESVVKAIRECKRRGREPFLKLYGYRRAREYYLVHEGRAYDSKAILGVAHKYQFGKALKYSDFSGGDKTVKPKLESLGFEVNVGGPSFSTERNDSLARAERDRRMRLWHDLPGNGVPKRVTPALLRDMGLYGGASGIWVAKQLTASITDDGFGVSVGLLHTGSAYADDLTESGILYHYPKTGRPPGRDSSEIQATKNARHLNIPDKAFDRKLIAMHPETFKIDSPKQPGQTRNMGVSEGYLRSHTGKFPHKDALMWLHRR